MSGKGVVFVNVGPPEAMLNPDILLDNKGLFVFQNAEPPEAMLSPGHLALQQKWFSKRRPKSLRIGLGL